MNCEHTRSHHADVKVCNLRDSGRQLAEVRVWCADCGMPFRFLDLPGGFSFSQATASLVGEEARLPIEPLDVDGPLPAHLEMFRLARPAPASAIPNHTINCDCLTCRARRVEARRLT